MTSTEFLDNCLCLDIETSCNETIYHFGAVCGDVAFGDRLIIFLGGGTKKGQQKDVERAVAMWKEYIERKSQRKKK